MKTKLIMVLMLALTIGNNNNSMAQKIHHIQPQLFKISFDDDYFNYRLKGTDKYYTAGLEFSLYFKKHQSAPPGINEERQGLPNLYFISLKQTMNTPNEIAKKDFQKGDYPYAGVLSITYGKIHTERISRFINSVSVGILGPQAFARQTQTLAHNIIHYTRPQGWNSQIKGQLMVNVMAGYEKLILVLGNRLDVTGNASLNAGTVFTNAAAGLTIRTGRLNAYFNNYESVHLGGENHFQKAIYFFVSPTIKVIGHDATLQGQIVNQPNYVSKDVYRIDADSINHVVGQVVFGVRYEGRKMAVAVSQYIQTAAFTAVSHHEYGNVSIAFKM
jgi:lipid A 3-O-deacylase